MRRVVLTLILPVCLAATVWVLASGNTKPEPKHRSSQSPSPSVATETSQPVDGAPVISATPHPPRHAHAAAAADAPVSSVAAAETAGTPVSADAPVAPELAPPDAQSGKAVYTPHAPRKNLPSATMAPLEGVNGTEMAMSTPETLSTLPKSISHGAATSHSIALTFDDGPNPEITPQLLKYLKDNNLPATFFLIGENVEKNRQIVAEMGEYGFEIGNHTYTHINLAKADEQTIRLQLKNTSDLIQEATGIRPTLMRPPYGNVSKTVHTVCDEMGLSVILWSVDSEDWKSHSADEVMPRVEKDLKGGSIILMHDRLKFTMNEVPRVVALARERGYGFVTVSQLIHELRTGEAPASSPTLAATGAKTN